MTGLLDGKIALVTGATGGIGRAAAMRLAAEGATVVAAARREEAGATLVAQIEAAGGRALFVRTDIADDAAIDALFGRIESEFGRLDAAFNNAAAEAEPRAISDSDLATFDRLFATGVRGTFWCLHHELRIMTAQKSGAIVVNGSVAGERGLAGHAIYSAAKHAVSGLTKTAALEVAALGVRVNCLAPGPVRSEMFERWTGGSEEVAALLAEGTPIKRVATCEEIAAAAAWLLSDQASYVTGATLAADGGMTAG